MSDMLEESKNRTQRYTIKQVTKKRFDAILFKYIWWSPTATVKAGQS